MANRLSQQFIWNYLKKFTKVVGEISLVQAVKATVTGQGITYLADSFGSAGNSITVTLTSGGTAGAEVVTVSGYAISVQIQSGVSTRTQVKAALDASAAAAALIDTSVTSGATAATAAAAVTLTGGVDGVSTSYAPGTYSITRTGVGEYTIVFNDLYVKFMGASFTLLAASAVDLVPQIKSFTPSTKTLVVRLLSAGTPTEVAAAATLYFEANFRDSSVTK